MATVVILANCRVSILRGTIKDVLGDVMESDEAVATGIPAAINEVASNETTMAAGMPRQVRYLVGRLPAGTDVRHEDRLKDEQTGLVYLVDGIDETASSPVFNQGVRLELRRVS